MDRVRDKDRKLGRFSTERPGDEEGNRYVLQPLRTGTVNVRVLCEYSPNGTYYRAVSQ